MKNGCPTFLEKIVEILRKSVMIEKRSIENTVMNKAQYRGQ